MYFINVLKENVDDNHTDELKGVCREGQIGELIVKEYEKRLPLSRLNQILDTNLGRFKFLSFHILGGYFFIHIGHYHILGCGTCKHTCHQICFENQTTSIT
ncbi:unnamed protein product [Schistosoma mattheei]|uniref:Uncharacterized protein n=1 Tax=Schistosoma mattheei TaxID=31246 RepID=A0AA85B5I5_9TREM|nr:unnamed protein product [Schistosoma mattheei]